MPPRAGGAGALTCYGTCLAMPALKAIPHSRGGVPGDPATGRRVPSGTYGSWKRCRECEVLIEWEVTRCPCCGITLSVRPRAARHRRMVKIAEARRAKRAKDGGGGGTVA